LSSGDPLQAVMSACDVRAHQAYWELLGILQDRPRKSPSNAGRGQGRGGCVILVLGYNGASFETGQRPPTHANPMTLPAQEKKRFRTIAHSLSPIVTIAQKGLAESVLKEIDRALEEHELIKVKIFAADRDARKEIIAEVSELAAAELVQSIGNIAVLYRAANKPDPRLSNILRHKTH
jgi:RNA-binding protein